MTPLIMAFPFFIRIQHISNLTAEASFKMKPFKNLKETILSDGSRSSLLLLASQRLEGNLEITVKAPSLPPVQRPMIWPWEGLWPFLPCAALRALASQVRMHAPRGCPASCLSSFAAVLPHLSDTRTALGPSCTLVSPPLSCSLASRWPLVGGPRHRAEWAPSLPPSTSKKLLLVSLFWFLELRWKISLKRKRVP